MSAPDEGKALYGRLLNLTKGHGTSEIYDEMTALTKERDRLRQIFKDLCEEAMEKECPAACDTYGHVDHCGVHSIGQTNRNLFKALAEIAALVNQWGWSEDKATRQLLNEISRLATKERGRG